MYIMIIIYVFEINVILIDLLCVLPVFFVLLLVYLCGVFVFQKLNEKAINDVFFISLSFVPKMGWSCKHGTP